MRHQRCTFTRCLIKIDKVQWGSRAKNVDCMQQAYQQANLSPVDPHIRSEWTPMPNVHPSKSTDLYKFHVIFL